MKPFFWTVKDILKATGGVLLSEHSDQTFIDISIDSRRITPHDLFIAIKGGHHDGHDFIGSVLETGVKGILIDISQSGIKPVVSAIDAGCVCIGVGDTVRAMGDLGTFRIKQTQVNIIGITGSNGKTTTKEMIAGVLKGTFSVLSTEGNLNNEIGLPLTLFRLLPSHQWAVLEMGMNHSGEILRLSEICTPDIGVITNVGPSHLEGLGSIEAVARAKGELLEKMNINGTAVLNADDPQVLDLAKKSPVKVCLFGEKNREAVIRGEHVLDEGHKLSFDLVLPSGRVPVTLRLAGKYMISNALAAASVGYLAGLSPEKIKAGLEQFQPVKGRMNLLKTSTGVNVIDDTYNANPRSTEVALESLTVLKKRGRSALVLGDMLELGHHAPSMHREIGEISCHMGVDRLFLTGDFAGDVSAGAVAEGMGIENIVMGTKEEIFAALTRWMKPGDWILVKGSRFMKMETIINDLLNNKRLLEDTL